MGDNDPMHAGCRRPPRTSRGGALLLEWEATDPDGDKLTYIVQSSSDNGKTWLTLAIGLREPRLTLARDLVDVRKPPLLRVIANDGWNSSVPKQLTLAPGKQ